MAEKVGEKIFPRGSDSYSKLRCFPFYLLQEECLKERMALISLIQLTNLDTLVISGRKQLESHVRIHKSFVNHFNLKT